MNSFFVYKVYKASVRTCIVKKKFHLIITKIFGYLQFLGKWYEVERTFYLPEIASSCTTLTFDHGNDRSSDFEKTLDISINSINHWTGSPSENIGHAARESQSSSIMDFQVGIVDKIL